MRWGGADLGGLRDIDHQPGTRGRSDKMSEAEVMWREYRKKGKQNYALQTDGAHASSYA